MKRDPRSGPVPAAAWTAAARARDASRYKCAAPRLARPWLDERVYETDQDDEVDFFMSDNVILQSG